MQKTSKLTPHLSKDTKHTTANIKTYPCPHCQKLTSWKDNPFKPFCSERCKLIDFGAWANEDYKLPAQDDPFADLN